MSIRSAIAACQKHMGKKPLFTPPTRRVIPMRHRELGVVLAGESTPGLPTGVFIEVKGQQHSGKTSMTFALMDAVVNQLDGTTHRVITDEGVKVVPAPRRVLVLDFEHVLDIEYLKGSVRNAVVAETDLKGRLLNADEANVYVHQPDTLEEGGEVMLYMIESGEIGLVVMDSIAAMLPEEERRKKMGEVTVGAQARGMSVMLRKSAHLVRRYGVPVVMVNQWREKIGVSFGDPRTSPGGKAPGFYDAVTLDVSGPHKTPYFADGKLVTIKALKNKITGIKHTKDREGGACTYHLERGHGLSAEIELLQRCLAAKVVKWSGRPRQPITVLDRKSRRFDSLAAWCEQLRVGSLFDALSSECDRRGVARVPRGNGGFDGD